MSSVLTVKMMIIIFTSNNDKMAKLLLMINEYSGNDHGNVANKMIIIKL